MHARAFAMRAHLIDIYLLNFAYSLAVTLTVNTFIENLAQELANNKWDAEGIARNVNVEGTNFDLYAARQSMQYWRAYVKASLQFIDKPTFQEYTRVYEVLRKKAQSWGVGDISVLCIIAERGMSPDMIPKVNDYSIGVFQMKSGGCILCIVDLPKRTTYMKVPKLPIPVHKISGEFKEIIDRALSR